MNNFKEGPKLKLETTKGTKFAILTNFFGNYLEFKKSFSYSFG